MSAEPSMVDADSCPSMLISQHRIEPSESSGTRANFEHIISSGAPEASAVLDILMPLNIWMLPPELLTECFVWLDLRDRVRVSCVSPVWRAIASAHPRLWSTIKMNLEAICDVDMLGTILERTGTRTLEMELRICRRTSTGRTILSESLFAHADALFTILNKVRDRIGSLSIHGMDNHLPLRHLQPSTGGSGCLHTLDVVAFSFTDVNAPWTHLVSFAGDIMRHDLSEFFTLCPNLVRLELRGIPWDNTSQYRNVPLSLTHLILAVHDDVPQYLHRNFSQHPLRSVTVKTYDVQLIMALEAFSAAFYVPVRSLNICASHLTAYSSDGRSLTMKYRGVRHLTSSIFTLGPRPQMFESHLSGLRSLYVYCIFRGLLYASLVLPVLAELVLEDTRMPDSFSPDRHRLCVPALRKLSLRYTKYAHVSMTQGFAARIPELWAKCIQPVGLRIRTLVFGPGPADEGHCNVALDALGLHRAVEIADSVYVDDELIFCALPSRGSDVAVPS